MYNLTPATRLSRVGKTADISASLVNKYSMANTDRRSRHEAREWRRDGNWEFLEIPAAFLWLEDACAATALDPDQSVECQASAVLGLWP